MKKALILMVIISAYMVGCTKNEEVDIEVRVKAEYSDNPIVLFEKLQYPDGKSFYFTRISFFVENLQLYNEDKTITLINRDYIDLSPNLQNTLSSNEGSLLFSGVVEEGTYNLRLSVGVNNFDNSRGPAGRSPNDPLSQGSEYWPAWNSYIFTRIEGWLDSNGDGIENQGVTLHLGGDEVYRTIELTDQIEVESSEPLIMINIDMDEVFRTSGNQYDLTSFPQLHSLTHLPQMMFLADGFINGVSLQN